MMYSHHLFLSVESISCKGAYIQVARVKVCHTMSESTLSQHHTHIDCPDTNDTLDYSKPSMENNAQVSRPSVAWLTLESTYCMMVL